VKGKLKQQSVLGDDRVSMHLGTPTRTAATMWRRDEASEEGGCGCGCEYSTLGYPTLAPEPWEMLSLLTLAQETAAVVLRS